MNRYVAEVFGTFSLVFAGCGAIVVDGLFGGIGHVGISLVFGLVVMAMIYSVGNVSGAHLNPAVSLGFLVAGRISVREVAGYAAAQLLGAFAATLLLSFLFPTHESLGATLPAASISVVFVLEVVLTFLLMFVILNVSTGHQEKGIMAGVAVGGTIALEALFGGPVSGASMNPARSLAPAIVSGQLTALWVYLAAPALGAVLAAPVFRWIQGAEGHLTESGPEGVDA